MISPMTAKQAKRYQANKIERVTALSIDDHTSLFPEVDLLDLGVFRCADESCTPKLWEAPLNDPDPVRCPQCGEVAFLVEHVGLWADVKHESRRLGWLGRPEEDDLDGRLYLEVARIAIGGRSAWPSIIEGSSLKLGEVLPEMRRDLREIIYARA